MAFFGRFWWGLIPLVVIWAAADHFFMPSLERDLATRIEAADIETTSHLRLSVEGRDVIVEGAADAGMIGAAGANVAATDGVRHVVDAAERVPLPLPVSIATNGIGILVTGSVPSEKVRPDLIEQIRSGLPSTPIEDRRVVSPAALQPDPRALTLAMSALGGLSAGEVELEGARIGIRGQARDVASHEALQAALQEAPAGIVLENVAVEAPVASPFRWSAHRAPDRLVVEGHVPTQEVREALAGRILAILPDLPVEDRTRIARGAPDLDFLAAAGLAVAALAHLSEGTALLEGATLELQGTSAAEDSPDRIAELLAKAPAGLSKGSVALGRAPGAPYRFKADRTEEGVRLAGYVPNEEGRNAILAAARRSFLTEPIRDELALADGAPENFVSGAAMAFAGLSALAWGEAIVTGESLRVAGEALYAQAGERVAARVGKGLPEGWTAIFDIKTPGAAQDAQGAACQAKIGERLARGQVQFEVASAEIDESSETLLAEIAGIVEECRGAAIEIGGHTDADGSAAANRKLSQERAQAVAARLAKHGVDPRRLSAVGYGQSRPVAPNDNPQNKALNRRIEFVVVGGERLAQ